MRIYKALAPVKALSFDLDDTLYANTAVIAKAEVAMQQQLAQLLPASFHNNTVYWFEQRKILATEDKEVRHDVSRWRLLALQRGLTAQGMHAAQATEIAELAMSAFLQARTDIQLTPEVRPLLEQLAARFPLVAITNGNADIKKMGIADLFQFALRAGPDGRMKPYPDMFLTAAERLALPPPHILHIGDHVKSDVLGALSAGCQAAWLNLTPDTPAKLKTLPHVELHQLADLAKFG